MRFESFNFLNISNKGFDLFNIGYYKNKELKSKSLLGFYIGIETIYIDFLFFEFEVLK